MQKPDNISDLDWKELINKNKNITIKTIKKINSGYPIQYLIGDVDFFDCIIEVKKHVLIPRFETELLVEKAIKEIKQKFKKNIDIIDFGTGSGCIAIKLAKEFPNNNVTAIDKSKKAIKLAKKNAILNEVTINFLISKFNKYEGGLFDVLISNPPYIPKDGMIDINVQKHEPKLALFAKDKGLYYYNQILEKSKEIMKEKNIIFFEIGYDQKEPLEKIIRKYYPKAKIVFDKDYNNLDRFCTIYNNV